MRTHHYPQRPPGHARPPDIETAALLVALAHEQLAHARRRLYRALDARRAEGGRHEGVCGTPAGYRRHQRAHEPPCLVCVDAYSYDERRRRTRARRAA